MKKEKPRLSYAAFNAMSKQGTIAHLIQMVIDDISSSPTLKRLGSSQLCTLRQIQRLPIGNVMAMEMKKQDVIDHARLRRKTVKASTVNQDLVFLRGVINHAASSWVQWENLTCASIDAARHFLVKNSLIGKSVPRKRRPSDDEVASLLAYFQKQDKHPNAKIKMADVVAFALASARRRGEIVRITHGDVDYEKRVYWVRDVKHPTRKTGNHKCFVLWPELEEIIKRQPRLTNDPNERIFPYDGQSVGKRYIDAKKHLGIVDLRFHDNRRDCISRYLLKMPPEDVRLAVSGHDDTKILEKNYDGRDTMEIMKNKYAGLMQQVSA